MSSALFDAYLSSSVQKFKACETLEALEAALGAGMHLSLAIFPFFSFTASPHLVLSLLLASDQFFVFNGLILYFISRGCQA